MTGFSVLCSVFNVQCAVFDWKFLDSSVQCAKCAVYTVHCSVYCEQHSLDVLLAETPGLECLVPHSRAALQHISPFISFYDGYSYISTYFIRKLDGVGPVDNRPSTNQIHHFSKEKEEKCTYIYPYIYIYLDTRISAPLRPSSIKLRPSPPGF